MSGFLSYVLEESMNVLSPEKRSIIVTINEVTASDHGDTLTPDHRSFQPSPVPIMYSFCSPSFLLSTLLCLPIINLGQFNGGSGWRCES